VGIGSNWQRSVRWGLLWLRIKGIRKESSTPLERMGLATQPFLEIKLIFIPDPKNGNF
jgi:hypothetical protein